MGLKQYFTIEEIKTTISYLTPVFDSVRIVEPTQTAVISFNEKDELVYAKYTCFKAWNRSTRCENCTSICAVNQCEQRTKYEVLENNVFYVVSKPLALLVNGEKISVALEIISRIYDSFVLEKFGEKTITEIIKETNNKIYTDSLTGIYNRRYYDELLFLHKNSNRISHRLGFILIDLNGFKKINDTMGHVTGDAVIIEVANSLKNNAIDNDSVIRFGGDEFLITVNDCEENEISYRIEHYKKQISSICYDKSKNLYVSASFGYSYSDNFIAGSDFLNSMLDEADRKMYLSKKTNS